MMDTEFLFSARPTTEAHERTYQEIVEILRRRSEESPEMTNQDILAILGRAAGYCVGMHDPDQREIARATVTTNMDMAEKEVAGKHS